MKKILASILIMAMALIVACKETKHESDNNKPYEGMTVQDITFKGDDMARSLGYLWTANVENDGTKDATIDDLIKYPDDRKLKTVVLFVGIHNIAEGESSADVIAKYIKFYGSLDAQKIICVSIPPVYGEKPYNSELWPKIFEVNQAMKIVCRDNYIETWEITYTSTDGIYPDFAMNNLIKAKVDALMGTTATEADTQEEEAE